MQIVRALVVPPVAWPQQQWVLTQVQRLVVRQAEWILLRVDIKHRHWVGVQKRVDHRLAVHPENLTRTQALRLAVLTVKKIVKKFLSVLAIGAEQIQQHHQALV